MDSEKKVIYVSAAFMPVGRKLLIVQRPENGSEPLKWELPGGKVMENESYDNAIIREIREELDIDVSIIKEIGAVEIDKLNEILIIYFILIQGDFTKIKLNEHKNLQLINYKNSKTVDFCDADMIFMDKYESEIKKYID